MRPHFPSRQIFRVRLKQNRPEITIVRRRDRSGKLRVFVFHSGAELNGVRNCKGALQGLTRIKTEE